MRTRQEIFNLAWNGLKAQGFRQSIEEDTDTCMYRGPEGLRCAIGHAIPDDKYAAYLERKAASDPCVLRAAGIPENLGVFADELQHCHDSMMGGMEDQLRAFAKEKSLKIPGEP